MTFMWLVFVALLTGMVRAQCPETPALRDTDASVVALEQNLKFIVTGGLRSERADLLGRWLDRDGRDVDVLLLSEARLTDSLTTALPGWCVYAQGGDGRSATYQWRLSHLGTSPGGLALGVRARADGSERKLGATAGRRFRARPTTLIEGFVARLARYHKGWAEVIVDGSRLVWSHTQASYRANPSRGAGGPGRGRAGQFDDLADDLGVLDGPTLLTGDLNLLEAFRTKDARRAERVARAERTDAATLARFEERTGLEFHWFRPTLRTDGSFVGCLSGEPEQTWDSGARYDRVGFNRSFLGRHPDTNVRRVTITKGGLRLSDHDGIKITIPFRDRR